MTFFLARPFRAALRSGLCTLFGLLSLAACSGAGAAPGTGPAPGADVLRRAEFAGNGRDLYQTIAVLRPQWLNWAVDSVGQVDPRRVAVFVGNEHVGDLGTLQGMSTADVGTVRLHGAPYVVRTSPALLGSGINAGLYITRTADPAELAARNGSGFPDAPQGGMGYSVQVGALVAGTTANHAFDALEAAGYDYRGTGRHEIAERGKPVPTAQLGAWYALSGALRAEAHVERSWRGKVVAFGNNRGVEGRIASTDVDLMLSVPLPSRFVALRVGAGPAVRIMDASWTGSTNPVEPAPTWEGAMSVGYGLAAALTASTPLEGRVLLLLEAKGRYFGNQDLGEYRDRLTGIQMNGSGIGVSLGLGFAP